MSAPPALDPERFAIHRASPRGFQQAYVREGTGGTPLVLVHGWPETKRIWWRNVEPLAAAGFEVIVPDLRGFGDSDVAGDGFYDLAAYSRDMHALVHDVLGGAPGLVVVDEAYGQFAPWSAQSLLDDTTPLAVVRTYSKTWSMAATRLGYLIAPPWLVEELDKVVLPYHLDALKQAAGTLALRYVDDMRARVEQLVAERERLVAALQSLDVEVWPSAANFVLFRPRSADANAVWQGLVDRSVLVRNCASWNRLAGCLRVTIGTPGEDDRFLEALTEVLS